MCYKALTAQISFLTELHKSVTSVTAHYSVITYISKRVYPSFSGQTLASLMGVNLDSWIDRNLPTSGRPKHLLVPLSKQSSAEGGYHWAGLSVTRPPAASGTQGPFN